MSWKARAGIAAIGGALIVGAGAWAFGAAPDPKPKATGPRDAVMVTIPGGAVRLGDDAAPPAEGPSFVKTFEPYLLDRTPVTVAQFARFVRDTGYVTDAERLGEGGVLDSASGGWVLIKGANWRRPFGPDGARSAPDHPVTQVSWRDAAAFCGAYGARLPTEFEWERAARLGQTPDGHVFRAGDPVSFQGRYLANVWQGLFPMEDRGEDGYRATSPVGAFGETPAGLTDMAGNVWEWTASWYLPYGSAGTAPERGAPRQRVQRGGSFLCDPSFCEGFRATARNHATPDTALMHVGFRCAADPAPAATAGRAKIARPGHDR
jgi:sulfatase modifying factor 1